MKVIVSRVQGGITVPYLSGSQKPPMSESEAPLPAVFCREVGDGDRLPLFGSAAIPLHGKGAIATYTFPDTVRIT
ncbi:MAG TPA: hypothetical protein VGR92_14060 [Steroidobacteraceae bacterium]|nr:hypothetical protein [Steroidobacteraceae bacterium]